MCSDRPPLSQGLDDCSPSPPLPSEGLDLPLHMYGLLFRTIIVKGKVHCHPMRPIWKKFFLASEPRKHLHVSVQAKLGKPALSDEYKSKTGTTHIFSKIP